MDNKENVEVIDKEGVVIGVAQAVSESSITTQTANDLSDFIASVKSGAAKPKMSTAAQYWEPAKKGEQSIGIFMGFSLIEKNENGVKKQIPVATWIAQGENGEICRYMQGGVVTLDAFKPVPLKAKFVITFEGKQGLVKKFSVQVY